MNYHKDNKTYHNCQPEETLFHFYRDKAQHAVAIAVARGTLPKPSKCAVCGATDKRIRYHHDDYSKPLDVIPLCDHHHRTRMCQEHKNVLFSKKPNSRDVTDSRIEQWAASIRTELELLNISVPSASNISNSTSVTTVSHTGI